MVYAAYNMLAYDIWQMISNWGIQTFGEVTRVINVPQL